MGETTNSRCCEDDDGGSHYHCGHCNGAKVSYMGHYGPEFPGCHPICPKCKITIDVKGRPWGFRCPPNHQCSS